jgi:hypothetical protein
MTQERFGRSRLAVWMIANGFLLDRIDKSGVLHIDEVDDVKLASVRMIADFWLSFVWW